MDRRIFGLETEYGLSVETQDLRLRPIDPGVLYNKLEAVLCKHYQTLESDSFGRSTESSDQFGINIREGRFLESGARCYYDTGHVEWATPETTSALQAAIYELAGERTLVETANAVAMPGGCRPMLLKNNIDYVKGTTFGCHENYLVPRLDGSSFKRFAEQLVPFLVTRQIFAGAGKVGAADPASSPEVGFQVSQRADFIKCVISEHTRSDRAIVNTRDESLSDSRHFRRLHIIVGDSNRSPFCIFLKLGTTGLVLRLIESERLSKVPRLRDPVAAIKTISQDLSCRQPVALKGGGSMTAIEVQRWYLQAVEQLCAEQRSTWEEQQVLRHWHDVLDDLQADPRRTANRVDWMIKRCHLLDPQLHKAGTSWQEVGRWGIVMEALKDDAGSLPARLTDDQYARLRRLVNRSSLNPADYPTQRQLYYSLRERDLRYHDIDPNRGLYALLERAGRVVCLVGEDDVRKAQRTPPTDTRARLRAAVIQWAYRNSRAEQTHLDWGRVVLPRPHEMLALYDPFGHDLETIGSILEGRSPDTGSEINIRILRVEEVRSRRTQGPGSSEPGGRWQRIKGMLGMGR